MNTNFAAGVSLVSLFLSAFLIVACDQAPGTSGASVTTTAARKVDCNLIAATDIERIVGVLPSGSEPIPQSQFSGCQWLFQDNARILASISQLPRDNAYYVSFDKYVTSMTEQYGKETVDGQKEIAGLGALAVFHPSTNVLVTYASDMDLYVHASKRAAGEAEIVALTKLALERLQ